MNLRRVFNFTVLLLLSIAAIPVAESTAAFLSGDLSELDPVSSDCVSCHDGSQGVHIRFCTLSQLGTECGGHIISVVYDELVAQKKGLNPASSLPPELVLFNGILTCVTCHGDDPHSGNPLAMDNFSSALCRSCHLK